MDTVETFAAVMQEFHEIADQLYGMYLDCAHGLEMFTARFASMISASGPVPVPGARLIYGEGDPNRPDAKQLHAVPITDLLERNKPDGSTQAMLSQSCINLLIAVWEEDVRERLATAAGLKNKNEIKSDFFRDLNRCRNAILHNRGVLDVAPKAITFVAKDEKIVLSKADMNDLFRLLYAEMEALTVAYSPSALRRQRLPVSATDLHVLEFLRLWNLQDPVYLDYEDVGEGYEPNFCHVSAKHIVSKRGGRRIHGWALWQFGEVIVGDFHSVWETPDSIITDVTPPKVGARILFVRDPTLAISKVGNVQRLYNNRTNVTQAPRLWNGNLTGEDFFSVPDDQPSLVAYCEKLGLSDTLMA